MNCRDIAGILDNRSRAQLSAAERQEAEEHLASCADCASEWRVEQCLAMLPDLTPSADFRARCRAQVAMPPAQASQHRSRQRVLMGTIVALAAVAAMLMMFPRQPAAERPPGDLLQTGAPASGFTGEASPDAISGSSPAAAEQAQPVSSALAESPRFTVRLRMPDSPADGGAAAEESDARFFGSMASQVQRYRQDPARRQALSALHLALVGELRMIPGLALVEADLPATEPPYRHYVVSVGLLMMQAPDGKLQLPEDYIPIMLSAALKRRDAALVNRPTSGFRMDPQADCSRLPPGDTPCEDIPATAAAMAKALREKVFPPDPSVPRALQAKLRNPSADRAERFKALADLFKMQNDFLDPDLLRDPQVVRGAIALAAGSDAKMRAQIWRAMRGVGNPELIRPLTNSMNQDADEVRLAAIATLAADFAGDPAVKGLLYSVAAGDRQPLVRALAERQLSGEAWWDDYVVRSLQDSTRPAAQRMEALVHELYPPTLPGSMENSEDWFERMGTLLDDSALRGLAEALPQAGTLRADRSLAGSLISNIGYRYNTHPAIKDMLLRVLEHDPLPRNRTIAGEVLARTHGNDARVAQSLDRAMRGDADPKVRDWIRQVRGIKEP